MSVPKAQRGESDMEFLHTARELEIFSIRKCVNFPKRYTFYVSQPIANCAMRIYDDVKMGNSIYPTNQHEAQIRKDYFMAANAELESLTSQIEVAAEMFGVDTKIMEEWSKMISKEMRLIKAVIKKDKERYKDLP